MCECSTQRLSTVLDTTPGDGDGLNSDLSALGDGDGGGGGGGGEGSDDGFGLVLCEGGAGEEGDGSREDGGGVHFGGWVVGWLGVVLVELDGRGAEMKREGGGVRLSWKSEEC
jgi:hypothetical protein